MKNTQKKIVALRAYAAFGFVAALMLAAAPASAQYRPRPMNDPATGETFHIEAGAAFWSPTSDITVASAGDGILSGIAGSTINAKQDLGFVDQRMPQLQLTLRPAKGHKFRLQYIPIRFEGTGTIKSDIVFNGQRYRIGFPLTSTLDWKAYRFGYENDFVRKDRWFVGFILELKYTDVAVNLTTPGPPAITEYARARAPIPALGGIGRVYVVPNIAVTFEMTGFKIPDSIDERYKAHYVDLDIYGTINLTNNVGFQGGYRSLDMGYLIKKDTGSFVLKGPYFGIVARY